MERNEDAELIIADAEERMSKSFRELKNSFSQIRSGRATPGIVEDIRVDAYGSMLPLSQVGSINIPEPRLITIDVWDKSLIQDVEKAIMKSGRNLNPQNDGGFIRIALPDLNEERRKELVKLSKQKSEDCKVAIRNIRRDANDSIKRLKDDGLSEDQIHSCQADIQKITDKNISNIDELFHAKEKEILTV
ncbi:MAG: ribosome recycling factor [Spirochaetia bacterium]|nr:ribosome recycling factor [Spirochaetia bacterium]